jgi:hypothetical protein
MKIWILLLPAILLLAACHKDDGNFMTDRKIVPGPFMQHDTIRIDPGLQTQLFSQGSYWIYRNDATQQSDCAYVYKTKTGSYFQYLGLNRSYTAFYYDMVYHYLSSMNVTAADSERATGYIISRSPFNKYFNQLIGITTYSLSGPFIDSLTVGNATFYNIQESVVDCTHYSTAKSIGVVKKVYPVSSPKSGTWNLVRWQVYR